MIEIGNEKKFFGLSEAQALLPLIQAITEKHQQELKPIQHRLESMLSNDPRRKSLSISYFISHSDPQQRVKLSEYVDVYDPDWAC